MAKKPDPLLTIDSGKKDHKAFSHDPAPKKKDGVLRDRSMELELVRQRMAALGLTNKSLANLIGVSQSTMNAIMKNRTRFLSARISLCAKMAHGLQITLDDLFYLACFRKADLLNKIYSNPESEL